MLRRWLGGAGFKQEVLTWAALEEAWWEGETSVGPWWVSVVMSEDDNERYSPAMRPHSKSVGVETWKAGGWT